MHSNGKLYGSDNGPNRNFGQEQENCTSIKPDPFEADELNLIVGGNYYGHPNRLRANNGDSRQCFYRRPNDVPNPLDANKNFTQPIAKLPSSTNGICEFQTEHFGGQLRGQLIVGQWQSSLRNIKLSADGLTTVSGLNAFPPKLVDNGGLDVTQGPDGTLFVAGNGPTINKIFYNKPLDTVTYSGPKILSVFPRRGPRSGGSKLTIYGKNFFLNGPPTVKVGLSTCVNPVGTSTKITCTLPAGAGKSDVVLATGTEADSLIGGYRYTNGLPGVTLPPTPNPPTFAAPPPTPVMPPPTPLPPSAAPPTLAGSQFGVSGFTFVYAAPNNRDIADVGDCNNCFPFGTLVNIRADVFGVQFVGSVGFTLRKPSGSTVADSRIENVAPYAMWGDNSGSYIGVRLTSGQYTISAVAYEGPSLSGRLGSSLTKTFTISTLRK